MWSKPGNILSLWLWLCICFTASLRTQAATFYVDARSAGTNGLSWATAFRTLPEALARTSAGDEVWVAEGVHELEEHVTIPAGVSVYGGFAVTETQRTQRDWMRHKTILTRFLDDWLFHRFGNMISLVSLDTVSRLDGVVLANGIAPYGAGVYLGPGAILANNTIVSNRTTGIFGGAGLFVDSPMQFPPREAEEFFRDYADSFLRVHFPFGVTNIPVHPTNHYSPAVHRLLQVAANLYDATGADPFPSVFRPRFAADPNVPGGIIISGYYRDNDPATVDAWRQTNPYRIPLVIGARKGLPNFNELALDALVTVSRKLEFVRAATNVPPHLTNQLHVIGVSNFLAVEAWNSYTQSFFAPVSISAANILTLSATNSAGAVFGTPREYTFTAATNVPANTWSNYPIFEIAQPRYTNSFIVPLRTNLVLVPESVVRLPGYALEPLTTNVAFDATVPDFPALDLQLAITNRLIFLMSSSNRIIDYVDFETHKLANLTSELAGGTNRPMSAALSGMEIIDACWSTNRTAPNAPPEGVVAQINVALGRYPLADPYWRVGSPGSGSGQDRAKSIHRFNEFMFPSAVTTNVNLRQQAPFALARQIHCSASFQVNDPLVNEMVEHLSGSLPPWIIEPVDPSYPAISRHTLRDINQRYQPWGGNPKRPIFDSPAFNPSVKDPSIRRSDHWHFPSDNRITVRALDRIHRGTPWQTLYMDSLPADPQSWRDQFPDPAMLAHPTNDWRLIKFIRDSLHEAGHLQPPLVLNNTIVANEASAKGGAVYVAAHGSLDFANNVVFGNGSGIFSEPGTFLNLLFNCVIGNGSADYEGASPGVGSFNQAPAFVNAAEGDFSLLPTSPLIDAGHPDATFWLERSGPTQTYGEGIDIGAYEFGPTGTPVIVSAALAAAGAELELTIRGFPNQQYVIAASQDLATWTPIATNTATLGEIVFRDQQSQLYPHRFYRVNLHIP